MKVMEHAERLETQIVFDHINKADFSQRRFALTGTAAPTL